MYSLFLRNIEGFIKQARPDSYTERCFKPIQLMGNKTLFIAHKKNNTALYQNAKTLINKARELQDSKKYHRFGVLIRELEGEGIEFDNEHCDYLVEEEILSEQISLLWQCMFFNYVLV